MLEVADRTPDPLAELVLAAWDAREFQQTRHDADHGDNSVERPD